MSTAQELHRQAMAAALAADEARALSTGSGPADVRARARGLLFQAFDYERQAARSVDPTLEPSRSVLYRSAASLALECDLPAEALQLIAEARHGAPPPEIDAELTEVERLCQRLLGTMYQHAS